MPVVKSSSLIMQFTPCRAVMLVAKWYGCDCTFQVHLYAYLCSLISIVPSSMLISKILLLIISLKFLCWTDLF